MLVRVQQRGGRRRAPRQPRTGRLVSLVTPNSKSSSLAKNSTTTCFSEDLELATRNTRPRGGEPRRSSSELVTRSRLRGFSRRYRCILEFRIEPRFALERLVGRAERHTTRVRSARGVQITAPPHLTEADALLVNFIPLFQLLCFVEMKYLSLPRLTPSPLRVGTNAT